MTTVSDDTTTFPNSAMEEREYLASVRDGDTSRRLNAVRQLRDETDVIRACATRLRKVFEIIGDDEGMVAAQHIGSYVGIAEDRQQQQLYQHKERLNAELRAGREAPATRPYIVEYFSAEGRCVRTREPASSRDAAIAQVRRSAREWNNPVKKILSARQAT